MGTLNRIILTILASFIFLILLYLAIRIAASYHQGYSWSEMDWDEKGSTSISDFLSARDIGKRDTLRNGKKCVEYYSYKDGLSIKTVCDDL